MKTFEQWTKDFGVKPITSTLYINSNRDYYGKDELEKMYENYYKENLNKRDLVESLCKIRINWTMKDYKESYEDEWVDFPTTVEECMLLMIEYIYQTYDYDYIQQVIDDEFTKQYVVGKNYRYSQIPKESKSQFDLKEYGLEYIGQNAIHIRYHQGEVDIWFVWTGMADNEGILKCVYNN